MLKRKRKGYNAYEKKEQMLRNSRKERADVKGVK